MENTEQITRVRHALAHLLALVVKDKYPKAKLGLGPAIENGFYYDFDFTDSEALKESDLPVLEKTLKKLIGGDIKFEHEEITTEAARELFKDEPYKLELVNDFATTSGKISIYRSGRFIDLCAGPHIGSTKEINGRGVKLERLAGAYWKSDEKNKMMTRIYGLAFETQEELAAYLVQQEEAKKRDHRILGKELNIFTFDDDVGPGLPLWLPNGTIIIEELEKLAKETEAAASYLRVCTPHIAKESMYLKSGHLPYYEESMFPPMEYEGGKYYLKTMNCPHHHKIFDARPRTYKDLPMRLAEYGTCYRHEKSGELFGLMRVRMFQMNDAHIYCQKEQFASEFRAVNDMYLKYFKIFGIEKYVMRFSTHSPAKLGKKYVNDPVLWGETEKMVRDALIESKIPYVEIPDEAAFYGPKIDVQVWSVIGREFTLATNQVDFAVPARFGLTYTTVSGSKETPLCIHRAPLGTHERFIGFLIEHYAGAFPIWLSPVQVKVLPISVKHLTYAKQVTSELSQNNIRVELDDNNDTLGKKIRKAKLEKVPYLIVIGDKEMESGDLQIELRGGDSFKTSLSDLIIRIAKEIKERK